MKKINVFTGRFQPFHNGHLQACKDAMKENGLPTVVMYIHNDKFDERKPFNDEIIEKELNIIKNWEDCIEDVIWLNRPLPTLVCRVLLEHGYEPILWLAGEDRINNYKNMVQEDKIRNELKIEPPTFYLTNRYTSATIVREAIKNNDIITFLNNMPDNTDLLFDEFKEQLNKISNGSNS